MKREIYSRTLVKTALNITRNKIDSVRKNNITKSACRVYRDGCIGISGCFGEPTDETWKAAEANLALAVPYDYPPEENCVRSEDRREEILTQKEFLEKSEAMMETLHRENPNFIFSNKLLCTDVTETLKNDCGLVYENRDLYYVFSVVFKHVDSNAIMDGGLGFAGRTFDAERFLADSRRVLGAYERKAELPEEESIPVALNFYNIGKKIMSELSAEALGKKTSIFTEKLGTKTFSDNFTLYADRTKESIGSAFFDLEGSTLEGDRIALIENGVIRRGCCDKKNAAEFGFENTACGEGGYDDVPALGMCDLTAAPSDKTFAELAGKGKVICIDTMSGGDTTADGNFASPVQLAYLMEDGKFIGRLPEFGLSGNLYEMFGKDYIGVSSDKPFFGDHMMLVRMKISRG